jgi:hypothetical protein
VPSGVYCPVQGICVHESASEQEYAPPSAGWQKMNVAAPVAEKKTLPVSVPSVLAVMA